MEFVVVPELGIPFPYFQRCSDYFSLKLIRNVLFVQKVNEAGIHRSASLALESRTFWGGGNHSERTNSINKLLINSLDIYLTLEGV